MRRLVIVTGLSGAGKSQAMKSFEDFGFACLDSAPPVLARDFVAPRLAVGEFANDHFSHPVTGLRMIKMPEIVAGEALVQLR